MAHEILINNTGKASIAFVGEVPWHGLGQQLTDGQPIEVWRTEAGMDFTIQSAPALFYVNDSDTDDIFSYPERVCLYRSDSKQPLSMVSTQYRVVQPEEILQAQFNICQTIGAKMNTAGVLFGGKKFWALAQLGEDFSIGNDRVEGYVLLATSCDGSLATTIQHTTVRVVCNNTLSLATGQQRGAIKIAHNQTFDIEQVKTDMGINSSAFLEFKEHAGLLSHRNLTERESLDYFTNVFNPSKELVTIDVEAKELLTVTGEEVQEKEQNSKSIATCYDLYKGQGKGSMLASAAGTAWGALNAVTEFCDHHRKTKTVDSRLNRAWFGDGASLKKRAYSEALKLAA